MYNFTASNLLSSYSGRFPDERADDGGFRQGRALCSLCIRIIRVASVIKQVAQGVKEVLQCVEKGAVGRGGGVLLISNNLFRNQDTTERKKWVALVDRVKDVEGGEVRVLSEAHESGIRLEALGGIAALLSYPIYELDEDEED